MAIKTENLANNRVCHYSDRGMKIIQNETGILYSEAVDVLPCRYTYSESNEPVSEREITAEEALSIIVGGEENAQSRSMGHPQKRGAWQRRTP